MRLSPLVIPDSTKDFVFLFPGFCDVHVHFREPGFSFKETMVTGAAAAARGGYTAVCTMPNLNPVPDSLANLALQQQLIQGVADRLDIFPYGALTAGERGEVPADLQGLAPHVVAFSDDGRGVQSESMMRSLMEQLKRLGKILAAHCEDETLVRGGYIHAGNYAAAHGHRGIVSESEWGQVKRDLRLAKETGCKYHVCHISCRETVALIREAKREGVDVTCETAPHYLLLHDGMLQEDGRFRMNPPIRAAADRDALVEGLLDGTIDMIATDHAPHTPAEKAKGLPGSPFGVVGLETAFPVLYTGLVKKGILTLEKLVHLMAIAPRERFNIPLHPGDQCMWDLRVSYTVDPDTFLSMGRATPFAGMQVYGKCLETKHQGNIVWREA